LTGAPIVQLGRITVLSEQDGEAKTQTQIWLVVRCRVGGVVAWAAGLGMREGGRLLPGTRAPDLLAYGLGWPTGAE
jgi:hypothetical protein